jgi:pimeloyl-ACP methyl ester carboxylesterase
MIMDASFADIDDIRLRYVRDGDGSPVVLLHGWPNNLSQWSDVIPPLSAKHTVVAPDLRGFGGSSRSDLGYHKRDLANDIWRLMTEVLHFERFSVVGHSWGAVVGYFLAADHPESVSSVTFLGVAPPYKGNEYHAWWHLFHEVPHLPAALVEGREDLYFGWFFRNFAHPDFEVSDELLEEYLRPLREPGAAAAAIAYYDHLESETAEVTALSRAQQLPMPVLAVQQSGPLRWRADSETSVNKVAELLAPLALDIEGALLPKTGYLIPEERPVELAELLIDFYSRRVPR